jgi:hypothetical protein
MLAACGPAAPVKTVDSPPTPPTIDVGGWTTSVRGVGPQATMNGGRLEVTMPWSSHTTSQNPNELWIHLTAPCQLSGDFEVTAHYTLVTWPSSSGVWVGIGAGDYAVTRVSHRNGPDERYATWIAGTITQANTADMTGSLRLTRVGATITGYYKDAIGAWVQVGSGNAPTQALSYAIEAWSDMPFGARDVAATIDSLTLSGTKVNCS